MKFLIFNLAVIGALTYLVLGNGQKSWDQFSNPELTSKAIDQVKSAVNRVSKVNDWATPSSREDVTEENKKVSNSEKRKVVSAIEIKQLSMKIDRPEPKQSVSSEEKSASLEVEKRPIHKVPQYEEDKVKTDQVDSLENSGQENIATKNPEIHFMTVRERLRELNRLAREMELIFVEKLNM